MLLLQYSRTRGVHPKCKSSEDWQSSEHTITDTSKMSWRQSGTSRDVLSKRAALSYCNSAEQPRTREGKRHKESSVHSQQPQAPQARTGDIPVNESNTLASWIHVTSAPNMRHEPEWHKDQMSQAASWVPTGNHLRSWWWFPLLSWLPPPLLRHLWSRRPPKPPHFTAYKAKTAGASFPSIPC